MDTKKKIEELNIGWRNKVAEAMGMTPDSSFQIAQGCLGLNASDSSGLFLMSDAQPIPSAVGYYDPDTTAKRSDAYRMLLSSLLPEKGKTLKDYLGDKYKKWLKYRDEYYDDPENDGELIDVFKRWAKRSLGPREMKEALDSFAKAGIRTLYEDLQSLDDERYKQEFRDSADDSYTLYKYSATIEEAQKAINRGSSIDNFKYDSSEADIDLKHTFVSGGASGFWKIFSGGASGSFDKLDTKASSSKITIEGKIDKYATLTTNPGGWYDQAQVHRGFKNKDDNNIWDPDATSGDWDDFFNETNGSLVRHCTQFLLVSGYELTVTIHADFSTDDFKSITGRASLGIWPFFSGNVKSSHTSDLVHNEDSSISYTVKLNKGLIQIWGITFSEQN